MDIKNSVVAILNHNGNITGSGFIVSKNLVVTCAHVIVAAGAIAGDTVRIRFEGQTEELDAWVVPKYWRDVDKGDVSCLRLDSTPKNIKHLRLAPAERCQPGSAFRSFGYATAAKVQGIHANGTIDGYLPNDKLLQLQSPQANHGISGGPVFVEKLGGVVVGMITKGHTELGRNEYTTFATPTEIILDVCQESKKRKCKWLIVVGLVVVLMTVLTTSLLLWYPVTCSNPIQNSGIIIKPVSDVELSSDSNVVRASIPEVYGKLLAQGSIELSGLYPEKIYYLTLNGKFGWPPNKELRRINYTWNWIEGYWDFMTVTADVKGNVSNQYLLATLPPTVDMCSGQNYRAKFFVKDATNKTILGIDDFQFIVESSDLIPYTLLINISNELSVDNVNQLTPIPIRVTYSSAPPDALRVKGDSPVTVELQTLNPSGEEISPDALLYHWEFCCDDRQNKTSDDTSLPIWMFEPPTDVSTQSLTITVSNKDGYNVEVAIPFTIK